MPLGHIGVNVSDLEVSYKYYSDLMDCLGYEIFLTADDQFAIKPAGNKIGTYIFFYPSEKGYEPESAGLQHMAFMLPDRDKVEEAVTIANELGSEIVHLPREWPEYPPPYYAAFWRDPDGIMLEAVCHK